MSDELPPGWALTDIGSLGRYINGRGFKKEEWKKAGLPIIRIQNLNDESAQFNYSDQQHEGKYRVDDGDLLVAWAASLGVYVWNRGPAWLNQHIFRVEVEERAVTKPFLYYALKDALAGLYKKAHGSGMVHITKAKFNRHPISLPPLNEQKRIVSKIDELFSRIDEGERAMERVSKLVERYRQSVLKAAVTGELTRDWREARKAAGQPIESGEALLTRILTVRREAWENAELSKMQANGITPKDEAWKKRYVKPSEPSLTGLPILPEGWVWASLPMLCGVASTNGISVKGANAPPGIPALRLDALGDSGFDYAARRYIPIANSKAERLRIEAGDFFVSRANGSLALVGRAVLAQEPPELVVFPDTMIRYRPADELGVGYWLQRVWQSRLVREQIERKAKTTAGIYKISQGDIAEIAIPIPPSEERAAAISLIDQRLSQVESLSMEQGQSRKRAGALRQAILRSAFSGSLVSQHPEDEPASTLLQRIAVGRAEAKRTMPARGPKKKSR
ncbi:restriction endonuclease subunit S [Luteimonas sp. SJ-92]|uniref:Restriction endonuclease subunit S n=1 Tax=Luteimonas salinisoli TaxID=2752307 RepID=A0A853JGV0_9GAMM|nr:restriction endonuclease subunit S [Luteimonas salinisoli]NZA27787.1 restriction endonuclease subunit S [Luteimonas salinisoli]